MNPIDLNLEPPILAVSRTDVTSAEERQSEIMIRGIRGRTPEEKCCTAAMTPAEPGDRDRPFFHLSGGGGGGAADKLGYNGHPPAPAPPPAPSPGPGSARSVARSLSGITGTYFIAAISSAVGPEAEDKGSNSCETDPARRTFINKPLVLNEYLRNGKRKEILCVCVCACV